MDGSDDQDTEARDVRRYRTFTSWVISSIQAIVGLMIRSFEANPLGQDLEAPPPVLGVSLVVVTPTSNYAATDGAPPTPRAEQSPTLPRTTILKNFQQQEMGRNTLFLSCQVATALISFYKGDLISFALCLLVVCLCIGFAATINGILLRDMYPKTATAVELLGVGFVFLSFFSFVGSFLPYSLAWIPVICFAVSVLPLIVAAACYYRERPP